MKQANKLFARLAVKTGDIFGSPQNFTFWIAVVGLWFCSGPWFHYSNTWQLLINTPTTVIELFAAILIQYVGNRIERRQEEQMAHLQAMLETHTKTLRNIEAIVKHLGVKLPDEPDPTVANFTE